jgi:Polyketide cyclase / dehydrase and lipid transport
MKIVVALLLVVCGLLVVAGSIVVIGGALLPRRHKASRAIVLRASAPQVYAVINDFAAAPTWRADVKRVEILDSEKGRLRFREHGAHGAVTYEVVANVPDERLITRIVDRDLGYSGSWEYRLSPVEGGTRLTITEEGDVSNLFFRFMSRFVFGHRSTIDRYLAALAARLGENARPEERGSD